jgi:amidase
MASTHLKDWKEICKEKKAAQLASIPSEWAVKAPTEENVLAFPLQSGLLTSQEVQITETTDIELMLQKLHSGEWSSVEVTTAFYKRAIAAHQAVGADLCDVNLPNMD